MSALSLFVAASAFKILLFPAYYSTDFDVHRNWLAITHSLPLEQWYTDSTSEWTLDYPPFFAWFEWALARAAALLVGPSMLAVQAPAYGGAGAVLFQRGSVVATDALLFYATAHLLATRSRAAAGKGEAPWSAAVLGLTVLNPGLLVLDHIHFQYNGWLFGLLVLSVSHVLRGNVLVGAALFAALLNFKHIFLYFAPAYFVFMLRGYCWTPRWSFGRLAALSSVVVAVFVASLGPFAAQGQLLVLNERMFPTSRGLLHAYWAPNFWALYTFADKLAAKALRVEKVASFSGGLVQEGAHAVLPNVTVAHTTALILLALVPGMAVLWRDPTPKRFARCLCYSGMCFFMLAWHVHEKAALMIIIPLGLIAADSRAAAEVYLLMATVGHYSLFPLFETARNPGQPEYGVKLLLFLAHTVFAFGTLSKARGAKLGRPTQLYLLGLVLVELFPHVLRVLRPQLAERLAFLPLMLCSVYCALGMHRAWLLLLRLATEKT